MSYGRMVLYLGAGLILVGILTTWNGAPNTIGAALRSAITGK